MWLSTRPRGLGSGLKYLKLMLILQGSKASQKYQIYGIAILDSFQT